MCDWSKITQPVKAEEGGIPGLADSLLVTLPASSGGDDVGQPVRWNTLGFYFLSRVVSSILSNLNIESYSGTTCLESPCK